MFPKKGQNGENISPADSNTIAARKKMNRNINITQPEFHLIFSSIPPKNYKPNSESKLKQYNGHIVKKSDSVYWVFDPNDMDPWFVARYVPEQADLQIGGYIELLLSSAATRFSRNIMNAIQVAFRMAIDIKAYCYLKDTKFTTITSEFLKRALTEPQLTFVKEKQKEWLDRMQTITEKKMAPLEFPMDNMDVVRNFFLFEISNCEDVPGAFQLLPKILPSNMNLTVIDSKMNDMSEQATMEPPNLNENFAYLILDKTSKICKTKVEWCADTKVIRISPNYFAKPPGINYYRTLPFCILANCTFNVCKLFVAALNKRDTVTLNSIPLTYSTWKLLEEKLATKPLGIEFYQWINETHNKKEPNKLEESSISRTEQFDP